jgi:hypothetical protein
MIYCAAFIVILTVKLLLARREAREWQERYWATCEAHQDYVVEVYRRDTMKPDPHEPPDLI